jgi:spermidine synthase
MKGQTFRYYDINPDIVRIARTQFTFVSDLEARGGKVDVVLGDARLSLEREPPQNFDVLLLDAFSGDSVPVHLLTLEAFKIYQRHMKPDGIIVVHVSNRYLTLSPVVAKVAHAVGMKTARYVTEADGDLEFTDYMLVTNNEAFLKANPEDTQGYDIDWEARLWTDQDHNLFEILDRN